MHTCLIIHWSSRARLHLDIRLWSKGKIQHNHWIDRVSCDLTWHVLMCVFRSHVGMHVLVFERIWDLLLETLVVTAVTDAREMVSGSSDPARRIAFLSKSSMSRIAGSSGQLKTNKSTLKHWLDAAQVLPEFYSLQCNKRLKQGLNLHVK